MTSPFGDALGGLSGNFTGTAQFSDCSTVGLNDYFAALAQQQISGNTALLYGCERAAPAPPAPLPPNERWLNDEIDSVRESL